MAKEAAADAQAASATTKSGPQGAGSKEYFRVAPGQDGFQMNFSEIKVKQSLGGGIEHETTTTPPSVYISMEGTGVSPMQAALIRASAAYGTELLDAEDPGSTAARARAAEAAEQADPDKRERAERDRARAEAEAQFREAAARLEKAEQESAELASAGLQSAEEAKKSPENKLAEASAKEDAKLADAKAQAQMPAGDVVPVTAARGGSFGANESNTLAHAAAFLQKDHGVKVEDLQVNGKLSRARIKEAGGKAGVAFPKL